MYADVVNAFSPTSAVIPPPLLAGTDGLMALARARRGETLDPAAIHPVYIRRPDAEIDRDKRLRGVLDR
jgi:hypothetical protein